MDELHLSSCVPKLCVCVCVTGGLYPYTDKKIIRCETKPYGNIHRCCV